MTQLTFFGFFCLYAACAGLFSVYALKRCSTNPTIRNNPQIQFISFMLGWLFWPTAIYDLWKTKQKEVMPSD
jgi:hypothetical protein